jgi:HD-like signal output (HDOD) protein
MPTALAPADPKTLARQALRNVAALATLPEITARIIATVEDQRSSAGQLHEIISHDPALASRIIKVVNSAFYGLPGQIGSIERAIVLLGLNAVKNIAIAASLGQIFRGVRLCEGFSARDLWTHCIAVGITARELALALKLSIDDEAFLAGMIHDLGILVELQNWPEKFASVCKICRTDAADFCQTERLVLGLDHQLLGMTLAQQWKFPIACQQVAGFHHQPALSGDGRVLVTLVYIADTLCCQQARGFNLTALHQQLDATVLAHLGINAAILERITANLGESLAATTAVFA